MNHLARDFDTWWGKVTARLYTNGIETLPQPKSVDHEAFEAGMESDEWAWAYYTAGLDDDTEDDTEPGA